MRNALYGGILLLMAALQAMFVRNVIRQKYDAEGSPFRRSQALLII
jgi:drug/metabolite transporter superfamily protein YnfA